MNQGKGKRFDANGFPVGPNGGRNRRANRFPATCHKCGRAVSVGAGRLQKSGGTLKVQCWEHTQAATRKGMT